MAVVSKENRIDFRINEKDKAILELAAKANHLSLSAYILSICLKQAEFDLKQNEIITLDEEGRNLILSLLDNPPEPNDALRGLFK